MTTMGHLLYYMEMNNMPKVVLDGQMMKDKAVAHEYIKEMLDFPSYYGRNLDALWDLLSCYSNPLEIHLINKEKLEGYLGYYGSYLIQVFIDAGEENENISFSFE